MLTMLACSGLIGRMMYEEHLMATREAGQQELRSCGPPWKATAVKVAVYLSRKVNVRWGRGSELNLSLRSPHHLSSTSPKAHDKA